MFRRAPGSRPLLSERCRMEEHEACLGCAACSCHEPMPTIRLQLVMTVFLAVIVAISAWLWINHPEVRA